MAKLFHNQQFMAMALERELAPRGMQLSFNCTLLAATDLTREKWEGILSEASMKLVQLAHDHYTHQLEVEKTIQGQTLSTINENPKLTKNEKTTLQKITQTTMEEDQREAAELATSLAAKRAGQAPRKRKRDDSSPPKNYRDPDQGGRDRFKEPKPRTELYRSRQRHPPQRGRGERKDRNRE